MNYTRARDYNNAQRHTAADLQLIAAALRLPMASLAEWDAATLDAVALWQRAHALEDDGGVGPLTMARMRAFAPTPANPRAVPLDLDELRLTWPELTFFTDISQHQEVTDWDAFAAASPCVMIKVSEGVHHTDPSFSDHWASSKAAGQRRAPYHYAHHAWQGAATDPLKAVEAFWRRIEHDPGELPPILDLEKKTTRTALTAGMKPAQIVRWITTWLDWIERERGLKPLIYNHHGIVKMLGRAAVPLREWPQWMAAYPPSPHWSLEGPAQPYMQPPHWPWDAWQFSSEGRAPGVIGRIDLNVISPSGRLAAILSPPTPKAPSC